MVPIVFCFVNRATVDDHADNKTDISQSHNDTPKALNLNVIEVEILHEITTINSTADPHHSGPRLSRGGHHFEHVSVENSSNDHYANATIMARQGFAQFRNCPGCGLLQRNRIVGGRQASIAEFPWTVCIRKSGIQHCGGSIINKNYVLTAAHCVQGHDISKFVVIATLTNIVEREGYRSKVIGTKVHENFDSTIYDYDIALLKVATPFPINQGVKAVCLSTPQDRIIGQWGIVCGWGALKETDKVAPDHLSKLEVPVVSNEDCQRAKGMHSQVITERMICAGFLDGSKDACIGDSGGPLVWNDKGVWKQIGVVSWGIGCARPGFYGIYTNVAEFLPWIGANSGDGQC